jgi:hypothetical protein
VIAQVHTTSVPTPMTDEMQKEIEVITAQARKADGCEGILILGDPATGEGLAINLFRDQAAADAFDAQRKKLIKEAEQDLGGNVSAPRIYEFVHQL